MLTTLPTWGVSQDRQRQLSNLILSRLWTAFGRPLIKEYENTHFSCISALQTLVKSTENDYILFIVLFCFYMHSLLHIHNFDDFSNFALSRLWTAFGRQLIKEYENTHFSCISALQTLVKSTENDYILFIVLFCFYMHSLLQIHNFDDFSNFAIIDHRHWHHRCPWRKSFAIKFINQVMSWHLTKVYSQTGWTDKLSIQGLRPEFIFTSMFVENYNNYKLI